MPDQAQIPDELLSEIQSLHDMFDSTRGVDPLRRLKSEYLLHREALRLLEKVAEAEGDDHIKRKWNEEVVTTLPGNGIRMLKVEGSRIVDRRPVIGFIVTKGNFVRPVTTMAVLPNLYDPDNSSCYWVMHHPSGEVEVDGGDGVEEARLYASLSEFEEELMMEREPTPLYARYEEVMGDIGQRRRDQQRAEFEERVRQHTAYTERLELENEGGILKD